MSAEDHILELLVQWEEHRQQGRRLTVEELCPDAPGLWEALRQRIQKRQRVHALLDAPATLPVAESAQPPGTPAVAGYEVVKELGRGGMGVVYQAWQTNLSRMVALKMVLAGAQAGTAELSRFRREAEAAARLQHPNIVPVYEVGEHQGLPYCVLEYVGGGSLAQHLDGTPLSAQQAAQLAETLARAVQHAHECGVVHRDLKPANILLQESFSQKRKDAKEEEENRDEERNGPASSSPLCAFARNPSKDRRLRSGEVPRRRWHHAHRDRRDCGNAQLHGPRAGRRQGQGSRSGRGRLRPGGDPV
jgi:hypothetical protein